MHYVLSPDDKPINMGEVFVINKFFSNKLQDLFPGVDLKKFWLGRGACAPDL